MRRHLPSCGCLSENVRPQPGLPQTLKVASNSFSGNCYGKHIAIHIGANTLWLSRLASSSGLHALASVYYTTAHSCAIVFTLSPPPGSLIPKQVKKSSPDSIFVLPLWLDPVKETIIFGFCHHAWSQPRRLFPGECYHDNGISIGVLYWC